MSNRILQTICLLAIVVCCGLAGCSMCCGPYDYHYPAFGGKHQRVDPVYGRIGSIFSDPNAMYGPSSDSNLAPHPAVDAPRIPADDLDMEDLDSDDDDLKPLDRFDSDEVDELPVPKSDTEDSEVTASRFWKQRSLHRSFEYR